MGKRQTLVCTHCGNEDCDGVIYKIVDSALKGWKDEYYHNWRGCRNDRWISKKDGKIYFHWVMGHGIEEYCELEQVNEDSMHFRHP